MKKSLIILFLFTTSLFGQNIRPKKYRQAFSLQTKTILNKLDSLMCQDTLARCKGTLESKTIGESGKASELYLQYAELIKVATEQELLAILDNSNELSPIRGYALMAYIYKCEKEKKTEKHFNYKFQTFIQHGCIGSDYTFEELNNKVRKRHFYDPNPRYFIVDSIEQDVIKQENEFREIQSVPLRKE